MSEQAQWQEVCQKSDLVANSGIAVWTSAGPVAIFWLPEESPELYAIGHYDPISKANVLARGIVGDLKGEVVIASPLYKQHYSLTTGQCLEDDVGVPVYEVKLEGDKVVVNTAAKAQGQKAA